MTDQEKNHLIHIPILVKPIVVLLSEPFFRESCSDEPAWLVDCTFGGGGHTEAFLQAFSQNPFLKKNKICAIDRDPEAIAAGRKKFFQEIQEGRLELHTGSFSQLEMILKKKKILALIADLGFSSIQIDNKTRGMSFHGSGSLDMRYNRSEGMSCTQFLEKISELELEKILSVYGQEPFAKRIAKAIIQERKNDVRWHEIPHFVQTIVKALPPSARHKKMHAATKTFQALRIAVNNELEELEKLLESFPRFLSLFGRAAFLTFHSLEDRAVKKVFKNKNKFFSLTKKPLQALQEEKEKNKRSKSAKLRVAERRE